MVKDTQGVDDVHWLNANRDMVVKRDERAALSVYRVMKVYWQFLLGLFIGFLLGLGVFK